MITIPVTRKRTRNRLAFAAVGVTLMSLLAACTASSDPAASPSSAPAAGGTLRMTIPADEGCVDPQQNLGRTQLAIGRGLVDSLIYQDPETGEFQPWLASAWEVAPDGLSYTFTLRDDVTFSDDSALDAQTVKDNLDAIVALGAKARLASTYLVGYTGTEVIDPQTAKIDFSAPNAAFLQAVSTPTMGLLSDASTKLSQEERCLGKGTGSGPFTLTGYEQNQSQTLAKRADYAWAPAGMTEGAAFVDEVDVSIVPESGVRTGSLVSGQSDLMMEVSKADVATLDAANLPIDARSNPGIPQGFFVNTKAGPLADVAVRQALQVGIDRKQIVEATLTEYNKVATSALSSTTPGYVDLSDDLAFDPDKAKQILDDAGWAPGADGVREKDGQRLTMSLLYGSQLYGPLVPLMELAQAQYADLGIEVTLRPMPDADANTAWATGDFELRFSGLTRGDPDVLRTGYAGLDPELDTLLTAQATAVDIDARMKEVAEAQKVVIENGIAIPINELSLPLAHQDTVQNVTFTGDSLLLLHEISLAQ